MRSVCHFDKGEQSSRVSFVEMTITLKNIFQNIILHSNNFYIYKHCCPIKKTPNKWLLQNNRKFVLQKTIYDEQK